MVTVPRRELVKSYTVRYSLNQYVIMVFHKEFSHNVVSGMSQGVIKS